MPPTQERDPAGEGEPQAKKRRNRAPVACSACRRRRSRCEPLAEGGCYRCKQLQTECLFTTVNSLPLNRNNSESAGAEMDISLGGQDSTIGDVLPTTNDAGDISREQSVPSLPTIASLQNRIIELEAALTQHASFPFAASHGHDQASHTYQGDFGLDAGPNTTYNIAPSSILSNPLVNSATQADPGYQFTSSPRSSSSTRNRAETNTKETGWYRSLADPNSHRLVQQGVLTQTHEDLRDPVEASVITEGRAELAYQSFKHHFATVFPHPIFLRVHTKLPSHPFLRSACLFYIARSSSRISLFNQTQLRHLETNLMYNINAYHRGCQPSFEAILAAYILSMIPYDWCEKTSTEHDLDPARLAGLSYGLTRESASVNFERLAQTLGQGTPVRYLEDQINEARLHLGVTARHLWLTVSRCPWNVALQTVSQSQRQLLNHLLHSPHRTELDEHVDVEFSCLEIIAKCFATWRQIEVTQTPTVTEVNCSLEVVRFVSQEFDTLRAQAIATYSSLGSLPYLRCHISYCKWWITARHVWYLYRLPTPLLNEEVLDAWLAGLSEGRKIAAELINLCLRERWDLIALPKALGTALVLCFLTISTGTIYLKHYFPEILLSPEMDLEDSLQGIQEYLLSFGHGLAVMLKRSKENLEEYRTQFEFQLEGGVDYERLMTGSSQVGGRGDGDLAIGPGITDLFSGLDTWWNWQLPNPPTFESVDGPAFPGLFAPQ